jgi:hypothetical protein
VPTCRNRTDTAAGGEESGDGSDSDGDVDGTCNFLGAVGMSLDQLGDTEMAADDASASYAGASHHFVITDDDDGNAADSEVIVAADTDDARAARGELRGMVDGLIDEQLHSGDSPMPTARPSPHALTPDGKLVSIQQLVAQCNHLRVGEKPSKDRLTRVMQVDTNSSSQRTHFQVSCAQCVTWT